MSKKLIQKTITKSIEFDYLFSIKSIMAALY